MSNHFNIIYTKTTEMFQTLIILGTMREWDELIAFIFVIFLAQTRQLRKTNPEQLNTVRPVATTLISGF